MEPRVRKKSAKSRFTKEKVEMRNLRSVIFGLGCLLGCGFLANCFGAELGAQQQTVECSGVWEAEDCKKINDASGVFLYVSGELLEEADRLTNEGYEAEANKSYEGGLSFS
jgi:hypothetical protein